MRDNDITIFDCPKCSTGKLIKRTNTRTGTKFLGCTNFPDCKHTQRPEPEENERFPGGVADSATVWE
jgi:ssDNA-binding Zn-finger/Zn-ribbon topoisomerase 1